MLSAFQLETTTYLVLVEESQPLVNAVSLISCRTGRRRATAPAIPELGQSLATRPELEDIEHWHVSLKTMTACIFAHFLL